MVSAGPDAIIWSSKKDTFPFIGGVASLCLSWVFSPVLGALLAAALFFLLRLLVLRRDNAYQRAFFVLPIFVFLTFFMITVRCRAAGLGGSEGGTRQRSPAARLPHRGSRSPACLTRPPTPHPHPTTARSSLSRRAARALIGRAPPTARRPGLRPAWAPAPRSSPSAGRCAARVGGRRGAGALWPGVWCRAAHGCVWCRSPTARATAHPPPPCSAPTQPTKQIWVVKRRVAQDLKAAGLDLPTDAAAASAAGMEAGAAADAKAAVAGAGSEGDEAALDAERHAEMATPNRLQQFRKSRMWTAVTHSSNVDIHEVRAALRCAARCALRCAACFFFFLGGCMRAACCAGDGMHSRTAAARARPQRAARVPGSRSLTPLPAPSVPLPRWWRRTQRSTPCTSTQRSSTSAPRACSSERFI